VAGTSATKKNETFQLSLLSETIVRRGGEEPDAARPLPAHFRVASGSETDAEAALEGGS
jgi:hypothetical protein